MKFLFVLLVIVASALAAPSQLNYKVGDYFAYSLASNVQSGVDQGSKGALSQMVGTVEVQCTEITKAGNYMFVMNMFDVKVGVTNPSDKFTEVEMTPINTLSQSLGYDMYFEQSPAGDIVQVWYYKADDPYFVQVKLGAINSFQTHVIAPGTTKTVQEDDLVGTHSSDYNSKGDADGSSALNKGFTQSNVIQFADKTLRPQNVQLKASGNVGLHSQGYVTSTMVSQNVVFSSLAASSQFSESVKAGNLNGFDSLLTANGQLQLNLQKRRASLRTGPSYTSEDLAVNADYQPSTLLEMGYQAGLVSLARRATIEISAPNDITEILGGDSFKLSEMTRVAAFFRAHPERTEALIAPIFGLIDEQLVQRVFALLLTIQTNEADTLFINYGIHAVSLSRRIGALNTLSVSPVVSLVLREALLEQVEMDLEFRFESTKAAVLALGSVVSRISDPSDKAQPIRTLSNLFNNAHTDDVIVMTTLRSAFKNAGLDLSPLFEGSDFPYNQSYSKTFTLGGSKLSADFSTSLFLGTNFDCNQPTFNLEGSVTAGADVTIFGNKMTALTAKAIYGAIGSNVVANQIFLEAFGKVIYNQPIPAPSMNCQSQTKLISKFTSPGLGVKYVLWVGCIPVVLEAGVSLEADLSWGWEICPGSLSALVQLIPEAKLIASASADTDLLIVEGNVALDADFDLIVKPRAYVHGTECTVGVDVLLTTDPMQASLVAEWRKQTCRFWFFDCKWGDWNKYTLWSWSATHRDDEIYKKEWPIAK